jgi:hypothetical protein
MKVFSFIDEILLNLLRYILSLQFLDFITPEIKGRDVLVTNPALLEILS